MMNVRLIMLVTPQPKKSKLVWKDWPTSNELSLTWRMSSITKPGTLPLIRVTIPSTTALDGSSMQAVSMKAQDNSTTTIGSSTCTA